MEVIDPLFPPILAYMTDAAILSAVLATIISIQYRDKLAKVRNTWLKLGILLALILILTGAGSLGKWGFLPVVLFLAYGGWRELLQCIEAKYGKISDSLLITGLGIFGTLGGLGEDTATMVWVFVLAAWLAIPLSMLLHQKPPTMHSILGIAFGMVWITMPLAHLLTLVHNDYGLFSLLILLVMGNDGFSQGFGMMGAKKAIVPSISPSKTWMGSVGGFLSCLVIGYLFHFLVPEWQLSQVLLISGCVSLMALCGDLIASSLKRESGIKDFGTVLSVTGGILDKFDSLLFAIPPFYWIIQYIDNSSL
ncbi:MAG: phosphatidate cytidylyltransferase [Cyanobacteria bacterium P01_C01_bin.118]